jgi:hypothetical protein
VRAQVSSNRPVPLQVKLAEPFKGTFPRYSSHHEGEKTHHIVQRAVQYASSVLQVWPYALGLPYFVAYLFTGR